jgi:hypothetical protein
MLLINDFKICHQDTKTPKKTPKNVWCPVRAGSLDLPLTLTIPSSLYKQYLNSA